MTARYADTFVGVNDGTKQPADQADGRRVNAQVRVISAVIPLAAQASGDTIFIGRRPVGSTYLGHELITDTSLGTATAAIGIAGTPAKYRAAATFTATDTPTQAGKAAAFAAAPLAAGEDMILTVGTAALPGSGLLIVNTYFSVSR